MEAYLNQAVQILVEGFGQLQSNPKGILIALAVTIFLGTWGQWFPAGVIATAIHLAIEHFAPILAGRNSLALPPLMDAAYWQRAGVLLVGYLIVIGVFFFVKRMALAAAGKDKAKAKH